MEHVSIVQIAILVLVVVFLLIQQIALKKGWLVPVVYSQKQRLVASITVSGPIIIFSLVTQNYSVIAIGLMIGYLCYTRENWYKFKGKS